jgi:sarcosine oxidase
MEFDLIIVGAGVVGLSTALAGIGRCERVLVIDTHGPANSFGASGDGLRLFRLSYFEHAGYVPLLREAIEQWKVLGDGLYVPAGGFYAGPASSELVLGSLASAMEHEIDHQVLTAAESNDQFPRFRLPHDYVGFFESEGGYVRSAEATAAIYRKASDAGVSFATDKVLGLSPIGDRWSVQGERATYLGSRVVVAAGNATGELVPQVAPFLSRETHLLVWHEADWKDLPGFGIMNETGEMLYGFPAVDQVPGVKVGGHHRFSSSSLAEQEKGLAALTERFMPSLSPNILSRKTCDYDVSPDGHFMIGDVEPNLVVACGFSGHGYKFGSIIGDIVHDTFYCIPHELSFLDVSRFISTSEST